MNYPLFFLLVLITWSLVFIYGKLKCMYPNYKDILSIQITKYFDGWLFIHFIIYTLTGIFFPESFYLSMIIGIIWELIEMWIGNTKPEILKGIGDCDKNNKFSNLSLSNGKKGYWWYGQIQDIYADFLGFMFGKYVIKPLI